MYEFFSSVNLYSLIQIQKKTNLLWLLCWYIYVCARVYITCVHAHVHMCGQWMDVRERIYGLMDECKSEYVFRSIDKYIYVCTYQLNEVEWMWICGSVYVCVCMCYTFLHRRKVYIRSRIHLAIERTRMFGHLCLCL